MQCTWLNEDNDTRCEREAVHALKSDDNQIWANLCKEHDNEWEIAVTCGNAKFMMARYIRAQGGPKVAAKRMFK